MNISTSIQTIREHTIFVSPLNQDSIVLDLGANLGGFSIEMIRRFGCTCVAVEPSPNMFHQIPSHHRIQKLNLAVAGANRAVQFHISADPLGSSMIPNDHADYERVLSVTGRNLESLVKELDLFQIDLIKMDVEGAEIEILDACSDKFLQLIGQFSIEFHDFNQTISIKEVRRILERFEKLGFFVYRKSFSNYCDVLLINKATNEVSVVDLLFHRYLLRNILGLKRLFGKLWS